MGVWHLDVESPHPGAEGGPKGSAVRRLKWNVIWVQNAVKQFGPYLLQMKKIAGFKPQYERTGLGRSLVYRLFNLKQRRVAKSIRDNY